MIDVEAEQGGAHFDVVPEEDGDALAIALDLGDERGDIVDRPEGRGDLGHLEVVEAAAAGRMGGFDEFREGGVGEVLPHEADEEVLGEGVVVLGDGDRAEDHAVARVPDDECADPFPEKLERHDLFLVAGGDERAAELYSRPELVEEAGFELEEGAGVKAGGAVRGQDSIGGAEAVGTGDGASTRVPEEEVEVVVVEGVEVERGAGALADGAEGDLPEPADLADEVGDGRGRGEEAPQAGLLGEEGVWRERGHLGAEKIRGFGAGDGDQVFRGDDLAGAGALHAGGAGGAGGFGEEVGAEAEEAGEGGGAAVHWEFVRVDGAADAEADRAVGAPSQFAAELGGADERVDEAGDLEGGAVAAFEVERDDGGTRAQGQGCSVI